MAQVWVTNAAVDTEQCLPPWRTEACSFVMPSAYIMIANQTQAPGQTKALLCKFRLAIGGCCASRTNMFSKHIPVNQLHSSCVRRKDIGGCKLGAVRDGCLREGLSMRLVIEGGVFQLSFIPVQWSNCLNDATA